MSRELHARGAAGTETEGLLKESAQIVTKMLPNMTATARRMAERWSERDLLEPSTGAAILSEIEAEMERISPEIQQMLTRQRQIARRLRGLLEE